MWRPKHKMPKHWLMPILTYNFLESQSTAFLWKSARFKWNVYISGWRYLENIFLLLLFSVHYLESLIRGCFFSFCQIIQFKKSSYKLTSQKASCTQLEMQLMVVSTVQVTFYGRLGFFYTGLLFSLGIVMLKSRKASFPSNLSQTKRICSILLPPEDSQIIKKSWRLSLWEFP